MRRTFIVMGMALGLAFPVVLAAQDSLPPIDRGVRVGITYTPGVRPGMLMLGGERSLVLDSVRAIIARDLDYSDEFEMIALPAGDSLVLRVAPPVDGGDGEGSIDYGFVNYSLYSALGADFAINVYEGRDMMPAITLFDVGGQTIHRATTLPSSDMRNPEFRLHAHRVSDELLRSITGVLGVAATRVLFVNRGRIYRTDSDGADVAPVTPADAEVMSPAWSPDGRRLLYMAFPGQIYEHDVATGKRRLVEVTTERQNFTPVYAPDGHTIAFSRAFDEGTDIFTYNLTDECCLQRLTVGRLYDNLSPTFSPDGRRIAFVSSRPGLTQIYVMAADGTGQELFAPFEWGVTGSSNAPEWSPDGLNLAFHRDVAGSPQVFVMDVATQTVRQLTSAGRNYDPSWAPDGRHLAFVSERTGSRQVWIIDVQTGRVRQLTRLGEARLPAWSLRIAAPNN
jgi:TolB protein